MLNYKHCSRTHTATKQKCQTGILRSAKLFQLFHIYDFHISTIIIRHLDGSFGSNIMTSSQVSQRSWVQIPYGPDFFSGLISTTSSVVFIAARISYIRFFTAMHTYDFHISTIIIVPTCPSIWLETTSKKSLLWILLFQPLFSLFRLKFDDKFCDTSYNCFLSAWTAECSASQSWIMRAHPPKAGRRNRKTKHTTRELQFTYLKTTTHRIYAITTWCHPHQEITTTEHSRGQDNVSDRFLFSWSVGYLIHIWPSCTMTFCVGSVPSISKNILNWVPSFLCWVILTQPLTPFYTAFQVLNLRRQLKISLAEGAPLKVCKSKQRTLALWKGVQQLCRLNLPLTILKLIWH